MTSPAPDSPEVMEVLRQAVVDDNARNGHLVDPGARRVAAFLSAALRDAGWVVISEVDATTAADHLDRHGYRVTADRLRDALAVAS